MVAENDHCNMAAQFLVRSALCAFRMRKTFFTNQSRYFSYTGLQPKKYATGVNIEKTIL
jgi:hypothetical protein